jgi:menaquinol-cytochrome c reductase iron-sulfur subunit
MPAAENRRGFLKQAAAVCGAAAIALPAAVGMAAFLDPLRRKGQSGARFLRLATLEALPEDGTPRKVPVIAERSDAWSRYPAQPIGAVFLRRTGEKVAAMQVICPHAGCSIDFQRSPEGGRFFCPCHGAAFDLSGKRTQADSPSPRDMDPLEVEIRNRNEVWVKFQSFQMGRAERVAQR